MWLPSAVPAVSGLIFRSYLTGYRFRRSAVRFRLRSAGFPAVIRAFYEKDPEISLAIQESYRKLLAYKAQATLTQLDPSDFVEGLDLTMMYQEMYRSSEGYLWEKVQQGNVDCDEMEKDFMKMIDFWKSIYLRTEK